MKIFISAVTSEFKECRDEIASDIRARSGSTVHVQEEFRTGTGTLLQKLESYISQSDVVIVLMGKTYGAEPKPAERPKANVRRSYTQWEYFLAQGERLDGSKVAAKETLVYIANPDFLESVHAKSKVEPRKPEADDLVRLQDEFVAGVISTGKDRCRFSKADDLYRAVLRDLPHTLSGSSNRNAITALILIFILGVITVRFLYFSQRPLDTLQSFLNGVNTSLAKRTNQSRFVAGIELVALDRSTRIARPLARTDRFSCKNELLRLEIESDQTAYLYVFEWDVTGKFTWLFPKLNTAIESAGRNPFSGNIKLPDSGDLSGFTLLESAQQTRVVIVLSEQPLAGLTPTDRSLLGSTYVPANLRALRTWIANQYVFNGRGYSTQSQDAKNEKSGPTFYQSDTAGSIAVEFVLTLQP